MKDHNFLPSVAINLMNADNPPQVIEDLIKHRADNEDSIKLDLEKMS